MSSITIIGNLTRDPELRFTSSGTAVANLTVAEGSRRKNAGGEWEDGETTFWPVTVWGEYAEHVAESLTSGARVVVVGRTGTRAWTPTEGERAGQEQRRLELVADEVTPVVAVGDRDGREDVVRFADRRAAGGEEPPF